MMHNLAIIILSGLFFMPFVQKKDSIKTKPVPESLKKLIEQVVKQQNKSNDLEIEIQFPDTSRRVRKIFRI